jgi:predicted nucleic acid-binding protein
VVIDYLKDAFPFGGMEMLNPIVDEGPNISLITKMEVLAFNYEFANEQIAVEDFVNGSAILVISDEIVYKTILIKKTGRIKLPDAIIAATAIVNRLILITRNIKDFSKIRDLKIIDPFTASGY